MSSKLNRPPPILLTQDSNGLIGEEQRQPSDLTSLDHTNIDFKAVYSHYHNGMGGAPVGSGQNDYLYSQYGLKNGSHQEYPKV
jgi:hypothetical protein